MSIPKGTRFVVVAAGTDYKWSFLPDLDARFGEALVKVQNKTYGYEVVRVEAVNVKLTQTTTEFLIARHHYIATITAVTTIDFAKIEDAASWIRSALIDATETVPSISITKIGNTNTGAAEPTEPESIVGNIADLLNAITKGSTAITWVLVAGAVIFVAIAIAKPGAAKKTAGVFL